MQRAARGRLAPLPADLDRSVRRRLQPTLARAAARRPTAAAAASPRGRLLGPAAVTAGPAGTRIAARPPRHLPRRAIGAAFALVAVVAVVLAGVALAARSGDDEVAGPPDASAGSAPCQDQPYRPCGQPAAPGTDGQQCLEGRFDMDGDASNGCEAVSDQLDGTRLDQPVTANLVPADAVDRYPFTVTRSTNVLTYLHLSCDNVLQVTLTAPLGGSMQLDVLDTDGRVLGTAISDDGEAATVRLPQPDCSSDDVELVARVSWVGTRRTAGDYTLTRKGSW
jgi:hypothetical protein